METVRAKALVTGMVQGVFYRASTIETAYSIGGLTGWVRNTHDGRVEVVCEGFRSKVTRLVEWLHKGPPSARVTNVDIAWEPATNEFSDFRVKYD